MVGFCCELSMNMNAPLFYSHFKNYFIGECMYINIDEIDVQVIVVAQVSHIDLSEYALRSLLWLFMNLSVCVCVCVRVCVCD